MTNYQTCCGSEPHERRRNATIAGRDFELATCTHAGDRFDERYLKEGKLNYQLLLRLAARAVAQCIFKGVLSETLSEIGGEKFVLYEEKTNLAYFMGGSAGHYPSRTTYVYVYSVYSRRRAEPVYYEKENVKRLLLHNNGSVTEEPDGPLFQLRWQDRP